MLTKARFWQRWATTPLNERQVTLLNKLLDGFEGKLTSSKWAAIMDDALPNHITLFDLAVDPPALWDEQRTRLGL